MRNVRRTIDLLFFMYHGLIGVLVGVLLMILGSTAAAPIAKDLLNSIGSTLIVGAIFGLLYTNISRNIYYEEVKYLVDREESGFRHLFPRSDAPEVATLVLNQLSSAREVKLYGIAINLLWHPDILKKIRARAISRSTRVTILLADVSSPNIQERITEEEGADFPSTAGKENIARVVRSLREIETTVGDPHYFDLRLFTHYPTFSIIMIDDDIYSYPYGYKADGRIAPVLHLKSSGSPQADYYREQFDLLLRSYPRP